MLPPILEEIQSYTRAVENKKVKCNLPSCPRCREPGVAFKLHDRRKRTYLVVVERLVRTVPSLLSRWKCEHCKKPFTLYPAFALPRKRYLREEVFNRCGRYVEGDHESYRKAVKVGAMAVFHESEEDSIDDRTLSHSSLYRWLAFFCCLEETCRQALRLIRGKSPSSAVFRKVFPIAPWKYRCEKRKRVLQDCRLLLVAEEEYRRVFSLSIFPRLATVWPSG